MVAPSSTSGNWTEPTGGVFAKYQVSMLRPTLPSELLLSKADLSPHFILLLALLHLAALLDPIDPHTAVGGRSIAAHCVLCRSPASPDPGSRPDWCPKGSHLWRKEDAVDTSLILPTTSRPSALAFVVCNLASFSRHLPCATSVNIIHQERAQTTHNTGAG